MQEARIDEESPGRPPRSVRLVVPPGARYAAFVRRRFAEFAGAFGVPETELAPFVIAVGEALANAVEHARTDREITATCRLDGNRLVATVVDAGAGFADAERRIREARTPEPTAERGRGLALMRRCTDHVAIHSTPGKGTTVTLVRSIGQHRGGARRTAQRGG